MKNYYLAILAALCVEPVFAQDIQDFKCYVRASNGEYSIQVQYAENKRDAKQKMYGQAYRNGNQQYVIRYVEECVPVAKNFSGKDARKLSPAYPM